MLSLVHPDYLSWLLWNRSYVRGPFCASTVSEAADGSKLFTHMDYVGLSRPWEPGWGGHTQRYDRGSGETGLCSLIDRSDRDTHHLPLVPPGSVPPKLHPGSELLLSQSHVHLPY